MGGTYTLPAIIHITRNDWGFIKGHVEYVEMGNHWILLRFANAQDRMLVYDKRPYFVNGLNFVLQPWVVFFDPCVSNIVRVDQCLRIPRLPWEFRDVEILSDLLREVGPIIRVDQNTLLCLKGRFARVCVNLNITQPLSGSLTVARNDLSTRVPLIYEGLHEVCPLYGVTPINLKPAPICLCLKKLKSWLSGLMLRVCLRLIKPLPLLLLALVVLSTLGSRSLPKRE